MFLSYVKLQGSIHAVCLKGLSKIFEYLKHFVVFLYKVSQFYTSTTFSERGYYAEAFDVCLKKNATWVCNTCLLDAVSVNLNLLECSLICWYVQVYPVMKELQKTSCLVPKIICTKI